MDTDEFTKPAERIDQSLLSVPEGDLPLRADCAQSDLALVRRLLVHDDNAWRAFIRRYQRLIASRIRNAAAELNLTLTQPDLVEEVTAEVFSVLVAHDMRSLRQYAGRSRLATWLVVVVRRIAIRILVSTFKQPRQPDTAELDAVPASAAAVPGEKASDPQITVRDGLQELSSDDQRILTLFYLKKQSYENIARAFGITTNAVGPKLDRARQRLRTAVTRKRRERDSFRDVE